MIQINNLSKSYGNIKAVDNISFSVERGEILGFLGPNGAGKTTTMKILTGFIPPDEGSATILDKDIIKDSIEIRKSIGYLPEHAPVYNDLIVYEYLEFIGRIRNINKTDLKKRIKEIIELCGLENVFGRIIGELSKGFKQRVGLAQALIHNPDILILDEPTSGLDPKQIIGIRKLIKDIGKNNTVILCSHILPEVEQTCSRMIIINNGEIVAKGTPQELRDKAKTKNIIHINLIGEKDNINKILNEHKDISAVNYIQANPDDSHEYILNIKDDSNDAAKNLFNLAVNNSWVITEMYKEQTNLEDIFLELTME